MEDRLRSFICIELPLPVRRKLRRGTECLRQKNPSFKWVSIEGLHITLKFLGEQEKNLIESFSNTVKKRLASQNTASFSLTGGCLDAFPGMRRARTLIARVEGDLPALENIASLVETVSVEHGIPAEKRPFVPHITLARMRQPEPLVPPVDALWDCFEWRVENITFMKSLLTPAGPVYTPLAVWNLQC